MERLPGTRGFHISLSLEGLVEAWRKSEISLTGKSPHALEEMEGKLPGAKELCGAIEDISVVKRYEDTLKALISRLVPDFHWRTEPMALRAPFSRAPFFASPAFEALFNDQEGVFQGRPYPDEETIHNAGMMEAYGLILAQLCGIEQEISFPQIFIRQDPRSQLERYFRLISNLDFVRASFVSNSKVLTKDQVSAIQEGLSEPEALMEILPPEDIELRGFELLQFVDVTQTEALALLERDLISKESVSTQGGFLGVQQKLRILFRNPQLTVDLMAVENDQLVILDLSADKYEGAEFNRYRRVPKGRFKGATHEKAIDTGKSVFVKDLTQANPQSERERELLRRGMKSLIVAPVTSGAEVIGALELSSKRPGDFGLSSSLIIEQVKPFFSMALVRMRDEIENRIQVVIKEKCTSVHPSVEWRFRKAAMRYLDQAARENAGEIESIVFQDVYYLYGASDMRGSSFKRRKAMEEDLLEHLNLAYNALYSAAQENASPILEELTHRILVYIERVEDGVGSGEEAEVSRFLTHEVEPVFDLVRKFGPQSEQSVRTYYESLDPETGTIYSRRRDFEESVSIFNSTISNYLDGEQFAAQSAFPHYFDKHKTDGVDYTIYIGESMAEREDFIDLHANYLRLWQMIVACGIAWHAQQLKQSLRTKLDVTHLMLVSHKKVAIRFRFDEKRFDVDGASNTGLEIIRSRIEKATVKDGKERLTQPGKIAIVYTNQEEEDEIMLHADFLRSKGFLTRELELLDLDQLPDVHGLKAMRLEIDVESEALIDRARRTCQKAVRRKTTSRKLFDTAYGPRAINYGSAKRFGGNRSSLRIAMASFT